MIEVTVANHIKGYTFHISITLEKKARREYVVHITRKPLETDKEIVITREIAGEEMAIYKIPVTDAVFSFDQHDQNLKLECGYIPDKALRVDILELMLN